MTKAPSDQAKPGREARLQRALRENLMRRKEQMRARRVTPEASVPKSRDDPDDAAGEDLVVAGEEDSDSIGSVEVSDEVKVG
ncbi:hypothetical protein [Jiella pelagia]|uniref:Uncharacterized protein n=1 Tax=Jiella pelagia TaxID=2986949 RepID=A0ABY7C4G6_9HYPH|nr:hypothetical protein [Jiella pelagia]WAP70972.1 hypothetical protein OH818_14010 [Jiella pelagia]